MILAVIYASRDVLSNAYAAILSVIPPPLRLALGVGGFLIGLLLCFFFARELIERFRDALNTRRAVGATLRLTGGTYGKNMMVDPKHTSKNMPKLPRVSREARVMNDAIVILPDEQNLLKRKHKVGDLAFWTAHLFPTPAVQNNMDQAIEYRKKQLPIIASTLSKLRARRRSYSAITVQFAFDRKPTRSNTQTSVLRVVLPKLLELPRSNLFLQVYTPGNHAQHLDDEPPATTVPVFENERMGEARMAQREAL